MTSEKMLELLNNGFFNNSGIADLNALTELKNGLESNIRHEIAKSKGTIKDETIIKRFFKSTTNQNIVGLMHTVYNDIDYNVFCNGYAMILNSDTTETYGYENINQLSTESINKVISDCEILDTDSIVEVDIESLKYFCKTNKPAKREPQTAIKFDYYTNNGLKKVIGLSPNYLLDMLTYCKTNKFYVKSAIRPITIISDDGTKKAILCPVNILNNKKAKYIYE